MLLTCDAVEQVVAPRQLHGSFSVCIPWSASRGNEAGGVGAVGGPEARGVPALALKRRGFGGGCGSADRYAIGRWGEALVYQLLMLTRPASVVEWPNLDGESKSFYDFCVMQTDRGGDARRGSGGAVAGTRLSTAEYIEVWPERAARHSSIRRERETYVPAVDDACRHVVWYLTAGHFLPPLVYDTVS